MANSRCITTRERHVNAMQYLWQDGCWLTAKLFLNTQFIDRLRSVPDCKSQVWAVESERLVFIDVIGKRNCFLRKSMHEELFSTFWLRNVWTGTNGALKKAWWIIIFSCCHTPMGSQWEFVFKHDMELHNDALFIQIYMICLIILFSPKCTRAQLEVLTFRTYSSEFC